MFRLPLLVSSTVLTVSELLTSLERTVVAQYFMEHNIEVNLLAPAATYIRTASVVITLRVEEDSSGRRAFNHLNSRARV